MQIPGGRAAPADHPEPQDSIGGACLAAGIVLAATAACFSPLVLHPQDMLVGVQRDGINDLTSWYAPHRAFPRLTFSQFGRLPFWNPWTAGGSPFLGGFQTALFYPANWIFWILPTDRLISWDLVVHHLIAAAGAYRLSRRLGAARLGATFAAVAFGASPILIARTGEGHLTTINTVAWHPWAFLAYEKLRAGDRWGPAAATAVLALGFLAGHLQEFYYLVLMISSLCVYDAAVLFARGRGRGGARLVLRWGLAGAAALALVAVELVPLGVYLTQAAVGARFQAPNALSPGAENLWQLILPFHLGDPNSYRGPGTHYWETICYFGLVPLGLAIVGAIDCFRRRAPAGRLVVVGLAAFVLGFGGSTPLPGILAAALPGYSALRCPGRWLLAAALGAAVAGAFGIDAFARCGSGSGGDPSGRRLRRGLAAVAAAAAAAAVCLLSPLILLQVSTPQPGPADRNGSPSSWIGDWTPLAPIAAAVAALGLTAAGCNRPRRAARCAALLIPIAAAELAVFSNQILTTIPPDSYPRVNPLMEAIKSRGREGRLFATQFTFNDGEAMWSRIRKYQGYDPLPLDRIIRFTAAFLNPDYPLSNLEGFYKLQMKRAPEALLNLWSIRHVAAFDFDELPAYSAGWKLVGRYPATLGAAPRGVRPSALGCRLWENPAALPRAFVVGRGRVRSEGEGESAALRSLRPREEVLLEEPDRLPAGPRQRFAAARIVEDSPDRAAVRVATTAPGYLILTDSWYPGWTATIDGRPAPILPANVAFRAVALPEPGDRLIVFRYFPPGLAAGLAVSTVAAAAAKVYLVGTARGIRRAGRPPVWTS